MKFIVWMACMLGFAAGLPVARDNAARLSSNTLTQDSVHSDSAEVNPGPPDGDTFVVGASGDNDTACGDGILDGCCESNPIAELTVSDMAGDLFGSSVAASGDTVIVGAFGADSAYVFARELGGADTWRQVARLTASDASPGDWFGVSVSVSGDTGVVGAFGDGSAYVFARDSGGADAWGQVAKLTALDAGGSDHFGSSVSVSGDTVVVGSPLNDQYAGSAYVFGRNAGGADAWRQVAKLTASDAALDDGFGLSVSVDGDTIVVGSPYDDGAEEDSGSAYVFKRNAGDAYVWNQVAKLTASDAARAALFGQRVAVSGNTVVVGTKRSGSAYVFERDFGGTHAWDQVARLTAFDAASSLDRFGRSIAVSGDTIVVSAVGVYDAESNSAYVFKRNMGGADAWGLVAASTAPDAALGGQFGRSVSVSGETVVVGASRNDVPSDSGSAYILRLECEACDGAAATGEECDDGNTDDGDGCSATCQNEFCGDGIVQKADSEQCDDGNTADGDGCNAACQNELCGDSVVNNSETEQCDDGNTDDGDGCSATCQNESCGDGIVNGGCEWSQFATLIASEAATVDDFGVAVSISGDTAVVRGPRGDPTGSAYVFERNAGGVDAWEQVARLTASDAAYNFGVSVSNSGDTIVVGGGGRTYVFERSMGGAWDEVAKLTASDAAASDTFGSSVSVDGDTVVVGAYGDDDAGPESGSAYVFERNAGGADAWGQVVKLTASDAHTAGFFGASVSVSGDTVVVGALDAGFASTGAAYVFERNVGGADTWGQVAKLTKPGSAWDIFGESVSVSGDTIVVGNSYNPMGIADGSAYVFERNAGGADAWGWVATLTDPDASFFGSSVSVSGDTVVVGNHYNSGSDADGSASVFERNVGGANAWGHVAKLTDPDAVAGDRFGTSVAVSDETFVVRARNVGPDSGVAYIVTLVCEECDDGNTDDGDGCSSLCQSEMGPNLVASGGFERRFPWRFFTDSLGMFRVAGEEAVVTIVDSGSNTQLFQRFGGLVAGTYQLDFDVKSSVATRARTILVRETDLSWIAQAGFRARPAWSHVSRTLVVPADVPPGPSNTRLSFHMRGVPNGTTLHFDNVVLKRVGPD